MTTLLQLLWTPASWNVGRWWRAAGHCTVYPAFLAVLLLVVVAAWVYVQLVEDERGW